MRNAKRRAASVPALMTRLMTKRMSSESDSSRFSSSSLKGRNCSWASSRPRFKKA